jgi:hypothetical protein
MENKDKPEKVKSEHGLSELEYFEYMSKKVKSVNTITYPDGSKGELNKAVIVLL